MSDLKNRTRFTSTVDTDILGRLRELSRVTRIPLARLLDEALEDLFEKHKENLPESSLKTTDS